MAVIELTNSRNIAYNEGQPTGIREFHCHPYATESAVVALIGAAGGLPAKMSPWPVATYPVLETSLRVMDHAIRRDPNVTQAWIVTVTYRQRGRLASLPSALGITPSQPGAAVQRLDVNAQFEDAWRQWASPEEIESNARLLDENQVPRYAPFTPQSDIGGRKIDAAGYPTSVLRHSLRMTYDIVDIQALRFPIQTIGTRNSKNFVGFPRGHVLFLGCSSVELPNGIYNMSYQFIVDPYFHLKQIPKRQANGYVVLDLPSNPEDQTATGQAKVVSYVQPYPIVTDLNTLNPMFPQLYKP